MCYNGNMETATTTKTYKRIGVDKPAKIVATKCDRCGGSGIFHIWGTCFRCGGNGMDPTYRDWGYPHSWTDEQCAAFADKREAANQRTRERAAAKRETARQETWTANVEQCPLLQVVVEEIRNATEEAPHDWAGFMQDITWKASDYRLSPKQISAFEAGYKRQCEYREQRRLAAEARSEVPAWEVTGKRQRVEGVIATRKWVDSQFGSTFKLRIVTDAGQGLWVSCPRELVDADVDDRVALDCAVQVSDDDPTFAFGSRPTKGEVK